MSKKVLAGLLLGSVVLAAALPIVAQSPIPDKCIMRKDPHITDCKYTTPGTDCVYETNKLCGICCLMSTIYYVADWVFTFLIVIVILFVLWGAFELLQAAGEAEKINAGRNRIMWAAVGLGVALLAKAVPAIVRYIVGAD